MTEPVDLVYLNSMWARDRDPWHIGNGFYEQRKRDVILSCLPRERYSHAFEPGCAAGELTVRLAQRCDQVTAADYHPDAVVATLERVADRDNVSVQQRLLPDEWPAGDFDLIVLSEIGYFFDPGAWSRLCALVAKSAAKGSTVLSSHWLHDFTERTQSTADLHSALTSAIGSPSDLLLSDQDFELRIWSGDGRSVAAQDGLR
jgi:cyclopropane fatty-acyl-phospholipid synthase-like methyltransferase